VTTFKICAYDEVLVKLREFSDKALENECLTCMEVVVDYNQEDEESEDEEEGATLRR
jgi:hypothetical protein